jgi:uncharacterized heparinase superfamily protein
MLEAQGVLSRPDGTLHLFNDAANGIAPERAWLDAMGRRALGRGVPQPTGHLALPDAGYRGFADAAGGDRLLVDCGEPGPRYQAGHAHCDLLSFELDLAGRPLVVDSGVSGYEGDPLREYVRSTRAHNTVMVGGREQSELWGTFRMARRAAVRSATSSAQAGVFVFEAAYSPYHDRSCTHVRRIERRQDGWVVTDRVEGAEGLPLAAFLHLHPDWHVSADDTRLTARAGDATVEIEVFGADRVVAVDRNEPSQGWFCPEFGRAIPAPVFELHLESNDGRDFGFGIRAIAS